MVTLTISVMIFSACTGGSGTAPSPTPSQSSPSTSAQQAQTTPTAPAQPTKSDPQPKPGGTLVIATKKDAIKLDPGRNNVVESMNVIDQIFDALVVYNSKLEIAPWVAESWTTTPDGKSLTFKIRQGIKFHDGSPLTAEDVAFSFQRILAVPAAISGKRTRIDMIEKITVVDPYTVQIDLKYPFAPFLGGARIHIVPKKIVEAVGEEKFANEPVGSGPFKFKSWKRDEAITLVRNDDYWFTKPYLDAVVFKPIPDATVAGMSGIVGEVHVVDGILGQLRERAQAAKLTVDQVEGMNYYFIGFTQYAAPYNNVKFRRMVAHSVDLEKAIPSIFQGDATRAWGPVAPGVWPRDLETLKAEFPKPDKAKATALFEELISEGVMKRDTPIVFHVNPDPPRQKLAEYVVVSLKEIGVNASLKVSDYTAYSANLNKNHEGQMYILGTIPAVPDPDAVFNWLFSSGSNHGGNILGLKKSEVDDLLMQGRQITDRAKREEIYKQIQRKVILEQLYHIPGYHQNQVRAISPLVHGMKTQPMGGWQLVTGETNVWMESK